jgi:DNA-directed RNA polymerase specialized sigma24 family protein
MVKHDPTDAELRHLMDVAYRAAFRLLGSATDAEDVAQSAVVATVLRWSTVSAYADAWTARIAINGALGQLRTARRRADLSVAAVAATMGISDGAVKTHAHRGLAALRETLGTDLVRAESAEETDPARPVADTERQVSDVRTAR